MPMGSNSPLPGKQVERPAAQSFHDHSQQDEVEVAVDEALPRGGFQPFIEDSPQRFVCTLELLFQRQVGSEPRDMGQQLLDGDRFLAVALEAGQVIRHAVSQPKGAILDERHHGRGGCHHLGERRQVEQRIDGHRLARRANRPQAERFPVDGPAPVGHQHDGAGKIARQDRLLHDRSDPRQAGRVDRRGPSRLARRYGGDQEKRE